MSAVDSEPFPRGALIAAGAIVGISILATAAVRFERLTSPAPSAIPAETPVAALDLAFHDDADGGVTVRDSHTGRTVAVLAPGTNGFVRGVMRGLAHDRIAHHIGAAPPFRLTELQRGQMFLEDTATGRVIDLQAFGMGNRASFGRFLHPDARVS
jgi:putative photosynthetic complex assembly protein